MSREKFEAIRRRYRAACEREEHFREFTLLRKYASMRPPDLWLTKGERDKLDAARRAQDREMDKMFDLLDSVGGRNFRSGVPAWWVVEELTWEDAVTQGQMSVVPPVAWGYRQQDMEAFAAARESS